MIVFSKDSRTSIKQRLKENDKKANRRERKPTFSSEADPGTSAGCERCTWKSTSQRSDRETEGEAGRGRRAHGEQVGRVPLRPWKPQEAVESSPQIVLLGGPGKRGVDPQTPPALLRAPARLPSPEHPRCEPPAAVGTPDANELQAGPHRLGRGTPHCSLKTFQQNRGSQGGGPHPHPHPPRQPLSP